MPKAQFAALLFLRATSALADDSLKLSNLFAPVTGLARDHATANAKAAKAREYVPLRQRETMAALRKELFKL